MEEWVKLHTKARRSAVYQDSGLWHLWCELLFQAKYATRDGGRKVLWDGGERTLEPGQCTVNYRHLADTCGKVAPSTIGRRLHRLAQMGQIRIENATRFTLVTVLNWESYQARPESVQRKRNADATLAQRSRNADATSIETKDSRLETKESFDRFWTAYPRKIGKAKAWEAWQRKAPPVDEVLAAIEAAKQTDQWRDTRYIPHPTTWLNRAGWEDEYDEHREDAADRSIRRYLGDRGTSASLHEEDVAELEPGRSLGIVEGVRQGSRPVPASNNLERD